MGFERVFFLMTEQVSAPCGYGVETGLFVFSYNLIFLPGCCTAQIAL
jgi:hypothetical protein